MSSRGLVRRDDWMLRSLLRERLVVTLKDGQSFRGLFNGGDRKTLALLDAEYLKSDGAVKADGEVFVPRDHIAYIQRP